MLFLKVACPLASVQRLCLMQADRRALNITLNSIGTELTRDDRRKLYSNFGLLYPHGHHELASAEDFDQIRNAMEKCPPYQALFNKLGYGESQMLDKVGRQNFLDARELSM